jgi:DNA-binding transcriptional LysR family regulator
MSRDRRMREGSSIAATKARAVNGPTPGIVMSRRQAAEIRRRLATLERGTFASPTYITRFGLPASMDALEADGHRMVGRYAPDAPEVVPFNFLVDGKSRRLSLPSFITVTGPETNVAAACMGLGLIQIPRYRAAAELASGKLVEVLPQFPPSALPVHVLY